MSWRPIFVHSIIIYDFFLHPLLELNPFSTTNRTTKKEPRFLIFH